MIRIALLIACLGLPDAADDQYQFIVGLAEKGMHDLVIDEAEDFLRKNPRHDKKELVRYRLADALYQRDRIKEATPHFRALASKEGFRYEAESAYRLGQCELAEKRFDDAMTAFERVLGLDQSYLHASASFLLGEAAFQKGDSDEAARRYRVVIDRDGDGEYAREARYGLAWAEFRRRRFDDAITAIDDFLRRHRGDDLTAELCFLRGECLLESDRAKESLAWYERVESGPFHDAALRGQGFAKVKVGDASGAARAFQELLRRYPDGRYTREATLQCGVQQLQAGDAAAAVTTLSAPIAAGDAELLYWRSMARSKSGDAKAALVDIDAALRAGPKDDLRERLHVARGDALFDLGRTEDAAQAYGASNSAYALHAAAVASVNDGRMAEAQRLAEQLVARFGDSPYRAAAEHVLGECALAKQDYAAATTRFGAAAEGATSDADKLRAVGRLAWACFLGGDVRRAAVQFKEVAERGAESDRAEARYMLGRALDQSGDPAAAVSAWERYLNDFKDGAQRADVLLCLAKAKPDGGARHLQELLSRHADHEAAPKALFELAERRQNEGAIAEAAELYRALVTRYPSDPSAAPGLYGLAWCEYESGAYRDAVATLKPLLSERADSGLREASLELGVFAASKADDPDSAMGAFTAFRQTCNDEARVLGAAKAASQCLSRAGRVEDADRLLADSQRSLRGASPDLAIERAWLAYDRGDIDAAEKLALAALQAGATGKSIAELCFFVGERLFDQSQDARAIALYQRATGDDSEVSDKALYKEGFARLRNDDLDGAAERFAQLVADHNGSELFGESLFLLGECRYRQGRLEDAVATLTRMRQESPRHEALKKAQFRLGLALCKLKRFDEAEPVLTDLVRRHPDFENLAEAELWRGRALAARGNGRGARQAFDRVVATDRGVLAAEARIEIGRLLFDSGDVEKALSEFLKVTVLYSDEDAVSEGLYLAGLCLEKTGDRDRARTQYQEIVSKYPKSTFASEARKRLAEI